LIDPTYWPVSVGVVERASCAHDGRRGPRRRLILTSSLLTGRFGRRNRRRRDLRIARGRQFTRRTRRHVDVITFDHELVDLDQISVLEAAAS